MWSVIWDRGVNWVTMAAFFTGEVEPSFLKVVRLMFALVRTCFSCSMFLFFFSSRRRHTRSDRDWSSDVCSSDLHAACLPFHRRGRSFVPETLPDTATTVSRARRECAAGCHTPPAAPPAYPASDGVHGPVPKHSSEPWLVAAPSACRCCDIPCPSLLR